MSIDKTMIGSRIQSIRKNKSITQKMLAEGLGLSAQYVSTIERGKTAMAITMLSDIADFLKVDLYELIGETNKGSPDYRKNEMFSLYEDATPTQREKIYKHAKIVVEE